MNNSLTDPREILKSCEINDIYSLQDEREILNSIYDIRRPLCITENKGPNTDPDMSKIAGYVPACLLENLGDLEFCSDHGIRYPYVSGGMANGISSTELVESMGNNGMLGFFGAAGLSLKKIEYAIDRLSQNSVKIPFGLNLIHNPNEPDQEAAVVDLYLRRKIRLIEAAAYLDLTFPIVRYRVHGIHRNVSGKIVIPNRVIAKVSRIEVASKFFSPPPERFLRNLLDKGEITAEQAELARLIPMAQDITAEADSGGHTDNRPAITLFPTMLALRDRMQKKYRYKQKLRVGAAGGVATPASVAALLSMGAAYVVAGSINQACVESGTSDYVREMLANAKQADITMAPAADMFEMGVKVQVLKRGTMFAMRASKLYDFYRNYNSLDSIPAKERMIMEKSIFCAPLEQIWNKTKVFFMTHDPRQITRAEKDPKHKMALLFRWYLGKSSHWAISGKPDRKIDYQIWCGPAMGAFNEWVKGSFLEDHKNRSVVTVALNLLYGAAIYIRLYSLRCQGLGLSLDSLIIKPCKFEQLKEYLN